MYGGVRVNKANHVSVAKIAAQKARAGSITYQQQDCKRFVEVCVGDAGGQMRYSGSNDMFRNACTGLWPLKEAMALGKLLPGALLFIHAFDGGEPAKYKADGKGNASHVGIYCGEPGVEVAHSSASRGGVLPSTLKNAWTHVGWAREIDYGTALVDGGTEPEEAGEPSEYEDPMEGTTVAPTVPGNTSKSYVRVQTPDGNGVKIREAPDPQAIYKFKAPDGTVMLVLGSKGNYYKVHYQGNTRYVDQRFVVAHDMNG